MDDDNLDHPGTHSHIVHHLISFALLAVPWRGKITGAYGSSQTRDLSPARAQALQTLNRGSAESHGNWAGEFPRLPTFKLHRRSRTWRMRTEFRLHNTVMLVGPKGTGKSQLALDYCQAYTAEYQAVVWVSGKTANDITTSVEAFELLAPESDTEGHSRRGETYGRKDLPRFAGTIAKPALIVLDDLTLETRASEAFQRLWRSQLQRRFLITTTDARVKPDVTSAIGVLDRLKFSPSELKELLLGTTITPPQLKEDRIKEVMNLLGDNPRALHQVREYVENSRQLKPEAFEAYTKDFHETKKVILRDTPTFFQYAQTLGREEQMLNWYVGWKLRFSSFSDGARSRATSNDEDDLNEFFANYAEDESVV